MKITPSNQPPYPPLTEGMSILYCHGQGGYTIVDTDMLPLLSRHKWYMDDRGRIGGYGKFLHHLVLPKKQGVNIDHINGKPWDNRRSNLRYATQQENCRNRAKHKNNTSGHSGVYWDKTNQKFRAEITVNGKHVWRARFKTFEEAAKARSEKEKTIFKEFTRPKDLR